MCFTLARMRRAVLVANPASSGFTGALYRDVVRTLERHFEVEPAWPIDTAAARDRAARAAAEDVDVVVALGGDGVLHHVANGLAGTATPLGILPAGTTNVLARIHGIPRDPRAAASVLHTAQPVATPVMRVLHDGSKPDGRLATFAVGAGLDADVVEVAERSPHSKLWFGSLHYARAAIGRVVGPYRTQPKSFEARIDDQPRTVSSVFAQVHDLYTYFGRVPIRLGSSGTEAPTALTVDRISPVVAGRLVSRLAARRDPSRIDGVEVWPGFETVELSGAEPFPLQADGEHLGVSTSARFTYDAGGLTVLRH